MSETYSVVLTGKLLNDESLENVKANVGAAFKLNEAQLGKLFSGKPVALKRGLDKKQAVRLSTRLQQLGAHAVIKAAVAKPAAAEPAKAEVPFTDIVGSMPEAVAEPAPQPVVEAEKVEEAVVEQPIADEPVAVEPVVEQPAPVVEEPEAEPAVELEQAAEASQGDNITCPRCGHDQPHTTACGYCKMDLTMHIKRMEKRAKVLAAAKRA